MNFRRVASRTALAATDSVRRLRTTAAKRFARGSRADGQGSLQLAALSIDQVPDSSDLTIELRSVGEHTPKDVWVEHNGEFIRVAPLAAAEVDIDSASTPFACTVDTDEIVRSLRLDAVTDAPHVTGTELDGHVVRVYLGYYDLPDDLVESLPTLSMVDGEQVGLVRLGRAAHTEVSEFDYRDLDDHFYYPHITRRGYLVLEVDRDHRPFAQVRNDGLTIEDGRLEINGRLSTRSTRYLGGQLVVLGRASGFKATSPITMTVDEERIAKRFGLNHYDFTAAIDFRPLIDEISDDNADLYLDLDPRHGGEPRRVRIGKSRYLVRIGTTGGSVTAGDKTVAITPYYTFKAKNPSLYLETFDTQTYRFLQSMVTRSNSRTPEQLRSERPIWLIGELPYKAQDNGLQFFTYMRDNHPEIDAYYVIRSDSPEAKNLAEYDNVIEFRSEQHVRIALAADKIIGTHHPDFLYPTREPRFVKALKAEKVFLQHGVTAAKWMVPNYGKYVNGFDVDLITVCSEREKEFFVKDFGYAPEQVAVTGFARFDNLFKEDLDIKPGQLMIMPTWRPWLQDPEHFTESEYFQRWRSLLTSERFRDLMVEYDLQPVFCLHPNMQQYSSHFLDVGVRVVVQGEVDVQFLLKQSSMLVTDYSSVAFDFAFLHKPVVYYQFDEYRFAAPHADPKREFPGPVVAEESLVLDAIDEAYAHHGQMSEIYSDRADRFVAHRDTESRERIFAAISEASPPKTTTADVINHEIAQAAYRIARRQKAYLPTMKKLYRLMRRAPLDANTIVFESGQGKQFGDSPRAIYEELVRRGDSRKKVWIYNKRIPNTDDHTIVVKRHSPAFFWHLATAKYWINNHNFPHYIHRRDDGVYIQTWHGTPLKRMFLDQDNFFGRDPGYIDRVKEASAQWNALVSPSSYATKAIQSSYRYTGPVYEIGYPRNDVLRGDQTDEIRDQVRHRLSIPRNKTVVLYAPTFRDDQPTSRGRFSFQWPFDPARFVGELGDDVVLLVRTHVLVNTTLEIPEHLRTNIIDVSDYPDIQELFLASDMLVTDYSSSFFDYSVLEKPIIFYAYDLENYRDNLRGFYLDYEVDLPGPIAETATELFAFIRQMQDLSDSDRDRLREFAATYAPKDDGRASRRVIDELLGGIQ